MLPISAQLVPTGRKSPNPYPGALPVNDSSHPFLHTPSHGGFRG
jgi:hypothetical protein